jgi:phosphoribosylanthranilate isomerase
MKVQIYTMQSPEEALAVVAAGADHIGVTPSSRGLPGEIDLETARRIIEAVGVSALRVALTVESDPAEIVTMVEAVRPDVLHLCGLRGDFLPPAVAALRERIPGVAIMQAISVSGPEALIEAQDYAAVADYLILDTQAPDIAGIGASGKTHDWNISREIVRQSRIPVILAGGLGPDNVAEAIRAVRPWGVDSLTRTNQPLPGGGFRKDIARVRQFAQAAHQAFAE